MGTALCGAGAGLSATAAVTRCGEAVDDGEQVRLDSAVHFGQPLVAVAVSLGDQGLGLLELATMLGQELRRRDEDRAGQPRVFTSGF
jgi:hypothetical protein